MSFKKLFGSKSRSGSVSGYHQLYPRGTCTSWNVYLLPGGQQILTKGGGFCWVCQQLAASLSSVSLVMVQRLVPHLCYLWQIKVGNLDLGLKVLASSTLLVAQVQMLTSAKGKERSGNAAQTMKGNTVLICGNHWKTPRLDMCATLMIFYTYCTGMSHIFCCVKRKRNSLL